MRLRRFVVGMALVMAVTLGLFTAGPARAAPAVVFGPPAEGAKVTLDDTSIGGPALFTNPTGSPRAILAWTGTDAEHHLNFMTSSDGLHYTNKHTLAETSPYRPAVAFDSSGRAGFIVVAWTGRDAAHSLNVAYIDTYNFAVTRKLTLWGYTSLGAPGVAVFGGGEVALAWSATGQTGQHLNVLRLSPQGQMLGQMQLGVGAAGPNAESLGLTLNRGTGQLLLTWVEPVQTVSRLFFSTSTDAVQWSGPRTIAEYSDAAASMLGIQAVNMPTQWLAWTGTGRDTAHHLNVQYTESFPNWTNVNSKTTFVETDLGAPALGYVGVNRQVLVTWTGTDAAHHLNVAVVSA
jgi:hypothetical protein